MSLLPRLVPRLPRALPSARISAPFRPASSSSHSPAPSHIPQPPAPVPEFQPKPSDPAAYAQSPNVPAPWSTSQNPKKHAFESARFEQTDLSLQPSAPSAMGMVAEDPVRMVSGRRATCDGGGGALGHPKIFINLDKPGPKACGYCGIRFEQAHDHH